ncbi:MAG: threo-3-hydroxy-L-aspartate ammonia-lyase [Steroidobacter sp.]
MLSINFDDVCAAHQRIDGVAHRTPVLSSRTADSQTGARLLFKCENLQRAGAFKFRGAYNALAQFSPEQKARGVVAFSSGNHAQAIALSAQVLGMRAAVVMPQDAPAMKLAATRDYDAEVVIYDRYTEDREILAQRLADQQGMTLVPPFDHRHVMAGQGTVAKELIEEADALDVLIVPLGGGGLLSGCAVAARALQPNCLIIGVEPEAGNDGQQSFRSGALVTIETPQTIADGAQTRRLGALTFPVIRELVDDVVTVSDAELIAACGFFAERMKMIVEPTGCLAAAAALSGKIPIAGKKVGIVVSGGNVDLSRLASLLHGRREP